MYRRLAVPSTPQANKLLSPQYARCDHVPSKNCSINMRGRFAGSRKTSVYKKSSAPTFNLVAPLTLSKRCWCKPEAMLDVCALTPEGGGGAKGAKAQTSLVTSCTAPAGKVPATQGVSTGPSVALKPYKSEAAGSAGIGDVPSNRSPVRMANSCSEIFSASTSRA